MDQPTAFGGHLRRLRRARGLSLRDLAKLAHHSRTVLWEWENGVKTPIAEVAARLDRLLDGDGALIAATASTLPGNGHTDRLMHIADKPRTVDGPAVDALAGILANMRRLEDIVGPAPLLSATAGPLQLVENLVGEARGPVRSRVVDLAGQWAQFAGWLRAATGRYPQARDWYARTLEHATEVGNRDLIATSLSMRGNLAWMLGQPGAVVGLSAAAADQADRPGVRVMARQQQARGSAVLGEPAKVDRLLDQTEVDIAAVAEHPEDGPPWIYFYSPGYLQMQRGLAYRLLGRHQAAIGELTAGLAAAGEDVRRSEFVNVYVLHLVEEHLAAGNGDVALELLEQVRAVAEATGSVRLAGEVRRLTRQLGV